ncbi:MAG: hypothetical protein ACYC06_10470 [Ilumatobacteraceae bacterium]
MKKRKELLSDRDKELIVKIGSHHAELRENREAAAEIQLIGIRVSERATGGLQLATWVLAVTTLVLVVATLVK